MQERQFYKHNFSNKPFALTRILQKILLHKALKEDFLCKNTSKTCYSAVFEEMKTDRNTTGSDGQRYLYQLLM